MITTGNLGIVRLTGEDVGELRMIVFRRDKLRCQECGRRVYPNVPECADNRAHMAHIEGRGRGGPDIPSNNRTLCRCCHMEGEHNPKSVRGK